MAPERGTILLDLARSAIGEGLGFAAKPTATADWLQEPGATFVTLHLHGDLRGCMGTLRASRPLGEDVIANARASAFEDRRFLPLQAEEFSGLRIGASLLSPLEPVEVDTLTELRAALRPNVHGLVVQHAVGRGVFLPDVWELMSDPDAFLGGLWTKAGLPQGYWSSELRFLRFTTLKWEEAEAAEPVE